MTEKKYDWENGALLEDHTKKKHQILKTYFREYLVTRCQMPKQERFRLAVIDGFSGAGTYRCGSPGSPLIFAETLLSTIQEINLNREIQGIKPINIDCLLILNDADHQATESVKRNITPVLIAARDQTTHLNITTEYNSANFESFYPQIKNRLNEAKCSNVFFNLDQCGYSHVTRKIIRDIISSWRSAEVLLTFMIESLLAFLSPNVQSKGASIEKIMREEINALLENNNAHIGKKEWLGEAEKIVYAHLRESATFVSPFSIHNPKGWQYWLMHFSSSYRARQVYNDVLHQSGAQAHFGKAGLNMLSYDPKMEGQLYLFDSDSRQTAKEALYEDIPRFVAESGDTILMQDFYAAAYSETPAHSQDIHEMIMENTDMEVITEQGGKRRQAGTIKPTDTLRLKSQKSLFFMFPTNKNM